MIKYEIRDVVSDYGIYENGELKLILNSRANAESIKAILEIDVSRPNAAVVYAPEVAKMSDAEILAVFRLCCAEGYHCGECPLHGNPDGCDYEDIGRRVLAIAEKAVGGEKASIALINRQKAVIEEKSKRLREVLPIVAELKAEAIKEFAQELRRVLCLEYRGRFSLDDELAEYKVQNAIEWVVEKMTEGAGMSSSGT